jgi:hypothetical protein
MRKWVFVAIILAVFVGFVFAGEGDRRYDNIYSEKGTSDKAVNLPWDSWRYDLVIYQGGAATDTLRVYLCRDHALVENFRFGGTASTVECPTVFVVPFYGPVIDSVYIDVSGATGATIIAWK